MRADYPALKENLAQKKSFWRNFKKNFESPYCTYYDEIYRKDEYRCNKTFYGSGI